MLNVAGTDVMICSPVERIPGDSFSLTQSSDWVFRIAPSMGSARSTGIDMLHANLRSELEGGSSLGVF